MGACTTIDPGKDRVDGLYFGVVRVKTEPVVRDAAALSAAPVIAVDSRAFGVRIQNGIGAGWFRDQDYQIPADCRVVIFVADEAQLNEISMRLKNFKEGICTTVKSP